MAWDSPPALPPPLKQGGDPRCRCPTRQGFAAWDWYALGLNITIGYQRELAARASMIRQLRLSPVCSSFFFFCIGTGKGPRRCSMDPSVRPAGGWRDRKLLLLFLLLRHLRLGLSLGVSHDIRCTGYHQTHTWAYNEHVFSPLLLKNGTLAIEPCIICRYGWHSAWGGSSSSPRPGFPVHRPAQQTPLCRA